MEISCQEYDTHNWIKFIMKLKPQACWFKIDFHLAITIMIQFHTIILLLLEDKVSKKTENIKLLVAVYKFSVCIPQISRTISM